MTSEPSPSVTLVVAQLADRSKAEPAAGFPRDPESTRQPGLYSWWADEEGLDALSMPFGVRLPPLIYAGQAGATSTRSGSEREATLRSRIGGNHLNGNVGSSTFRKTLTSILANPLSLRLARPGALSPESNQMLSMWMRRHLSVITAPHPDRRSLASVEEAVLAGLDPPLNLMGMSPTPIRAKLRQLRSELAGTATPLGPDLTRPTIRSQPPARDAAGASSQRVTRPAYVTLHEAMIEVLRDRGWMPLTHVADEIAKRDLYRRRDGTFAQASQLRRRALQSGGHYAHLFQLTSGRIRLSGEPDRGSPPNRS